MKYDVMLFLDLSYSTYLWFTSDNIYNHEHHANHELNKQLCQLAQKTLDAKEQFIFCLLF